MSVISKNPRSGLPNVPDIDVGQSNLAIYLVFFDLGVINNTNTSSMLEVGLGRIK